MKKILVSGSLAYDHIYVFPGIFQDELVEDSAGSLSVAFTVSDKTVNFGGCAGNIAFNGKLIKQDFLMMGIAGSDFGQYDKWLRERGIDTSNVIIEDSQYTAQATVVNDNKGQQITFFHEGAAKNSHEHHDAVKKIIKNLSKDAKFAIISPNNREFIMASIEGCQETRLPYFFDPGQVIPCFTSGELINASKKAVGLFLNEYELRLFRHHTKLDFNEVLKHCGLLILTLGEKGSKIFFEGKEIVIPPSIPKIALDPTGCGDAYRAGFLHGIKEAFPKLTQNILADSAKLGSEIAAACLTCHGTQNHHFSRL